METPTSAEGAIDGIALFEVEEAGSRGPDGLYLSVHFRGASNAAQALILDGEFPPPGSGPPGAPASLHRRASGLRSACREERSVCEVCSRPRLRKRCG